MGYKKLSKEQELQLVEEYKQGTSVIELMNKYGYKISKISLKEKIVYVRRLDNEKSNWSKEFNKRI